MPKDKNWLEEKIVFFAVFFSFSGYFAGLAVTLALGKAEISRYYSIPIRVALTLSMAYLIARNWSSIRNFRNPYLLLSITGFWILHSFNVYANFNDEEYRLAWYEYILYTINYCVLPFFAFCSISAERHRKTILDAIIKSGIALAATSTFLYWDLLASGISRLNMAQFANPEMQAINPLSLSYAAALTMTTCIYKLLYSKNNKAEKITIFISIFGAIIMFLLGASRGSIIALTNTFLVLLIYSKAKVKIQTIIFLIVGFPTILFGASITGSAVFERFLNTSQEISEKAESAARLDIWSQSMDHFLSNPLTGGRLEVFGSYPHNIIIEILITTGLAGFALAIIPILYGFYFSYKSAKTTHANIWPMLLFIQGITQHMFSGTITAAIYLFIPMGIIYSMHSQKTFAPALSHK